MTYTELIEQLSDELGLTKSETRLLTRLTVSEFTAQLGEGNGFSIPDLGTFRVKTKDLQNVYSPYHGKHVVVPPKRVVAFTPGKKLKERVQQTNTGHE